MLKELQVRMDGWKNLLAGIGRKSDKTKETKFCNYELFDDDTLSELFDGEGLAYKIVSIVPEDMTRRGWVIENDEVELIKKEMTRLMATPLLNKALKYARLYRGAILVIVTKNGKLEQPLTSSSGVITHLRVYSAARVPVMQQDISEEPTSPYFEDVEIFKVRKRDGNEMEVHRSRCLVFKGELTSDTEQLDTDYRYWGFSIIQKIWSRLANYSAVERAVANLMLEFTIGKYKLSNLAQILAQGESGVTAIMNRMEIINQSKSVINGVMLGTDEDYIRDTVPLTGVSDVIDRMMVSVSTVARIPVTKLFERSPAGMNATGEFDTRNYYELIASAQELNLLPELQYLVNYISSYLYPETRENEDGDIIEGYPVVFNSLWEPSEKEQAETDKLNADSDAIYMTAQVVGPEEVRLLRYPDLDQDALPSFTEPGKGKGGKVNEE